MVPVDSQRRHNQIVESNQTASFNDNATYQQKIQEMNERCQKAALAEVGQRPPSDSRARSSTHSQRNGAASRDHSWRLNESSLNQIPASNAFRMRAREAQAGKGAEKDEAASHFYNCQFYMCKTPPSERHNGTRRPNEQFVSDESSCQISNRQIFRAKNASNDTAKLEQIQPRNSKAPGELTDQELQRNRTQITSRVNLNLHHASAQARQLDEPKSDQESYKYGNYSEDSFQNSALGRDPATKSAFKPASGRRSRGARSTSNQEGAADQESAPGSVMLRMDTGSKRSTDARRFRDSGYKRENDSKSVGASNIFDKSFPRLNPSRAPSILTMSDNGLKS